MSSQTDKSFQYFPLKGEALALLAAFRSELSAGEEEQRALHVELQQRSDTMLQLRNAKMREMWIRMAASVGLDPDHTFTSPNYGIEARYIDEGFGALTYKKLPVHPYADALGIPQDEEDPMAAGVPDKSKMN